MVRALGQCDQACNKWCKSLFEHPMLVSIHTALALQGTLGALAYPW